MKILHEADLAINLQSFDSSPLGLLCRSHIGGRRTFDEVVVKRCSNQPCLSDVDKEIGELDAVDHPNLVKMHGLVRLADRGVGIVVQPIRGERLSERLYRLQSPGMAVRLAWVRAIVAGVRALHAKHIVHGNLSLDTIYFADEHPQTLLLTDYGMARFYERHVAGWKLNERYTPPEVTTADLCSVQADIFALGLIIWQIVTLQRLPSCSQPDVASTIRQPKLAAVLARCLHVTPAKRPTLDELEDAFSETDSY